MAKSRLAIAALVVAAVVAGLPGAAMAAGGEGSIGGTTTNTSWEHYNVTRYTDGTIEFEPNNLLYQAGPVSVVNLRLRNTGGSWLSNSVQWQSYWKQTIISGVSNGTGFKISACCYSTIGGDSSWGGTLWW